MKGLSQQFILARAHECTTTTCTHALPAKIAETLHAGLDANLKPTDSSTYFQAIISMQSIGVTNAGNVSWQILGAVCQDSKSFVIQSAAELRVAASSQIRTPCVSFRSRLPTTKVMPAIIIG